MYPVGDLIFIVKERTPNLSEEIVITDWKTIKYKLLDDNLTKKSEHCDKTQSVVGWTLTLKFTESVQTIVEWYNKFYVEGRSNLPDVSNGQIDLYVNLANLRNHVLEEK